MKYEPSVIARRIAFGVAEPHHQIEQAVEEVGEGEPPDQPWKRSQPVAGEHIDPHRKTVGRQFEWVPHVGRGE
jgi:hypothetical protein